ncbi:MAG: helix-turn-helix domain-containing protein [Actinomycetota bacterium]|nr:helix-turn-helix domain-containing protein [Actinomycetota bacterium]
MSTDSHPATNTTAAFALCPDQLLFTTSEAARVLRVGRTTVYALIGSGELRPVHIGRSCRVSRGELERYVARLDTPVPSPAMPTPIRRHRRSRPTSQQDELFKLGPPSPDAARPVADCR